MPVWRRVLLWCLLGSLLVHAAIFDLFRLPGLDFPIRGTIPLQVDIRQGVVESPAVGAEPALSQAPDALPRAQVSSVAAQGAPVVRAGRPELDPISAPVTPGPGLEGLRAGSAAELELALRLALAGPLRTRTEGIGPGSWRLVFGADGALSEVSALAGGEEGAAVLRQVAAGLRLPGYLTGRPYVLELVIE